MRKIVTLRIPVNDIHRLMLLIYPSGIYLNLYLQMEDCTSDFDEWYETIEEAEASVRERFGVGPDDWIDIGDAPEDSRDDWIGYSQMS
jgi:hypothetical protein